MFNVVVGIYMFPTSDFLFFSFIQKNANIKYEYINIY